MGIITDRDVRQQVIETLPADGAPEREGIDVDAITAAIIDRYGLVDINSVPTDEYWRIVREHDATQK